MKMFTLRLKNNLTTSVYWFDHLDEILSVNRMFQSIHLSTEGANINYRGGQTNVSRPPQEQTEAIVKVVMRPRSLLSQVQKLTINKIQLHRSNDFGEILARMPLLKDLEIQSLTIEKKHEVGSLKPTLVLLKSVKAVTSDSTLFLHFIAPNIQSLQLIQPLGPHNCYMNLLYRGKLDSLEIDLSIMFFVSPPSILDLKLKKLSIHSLVEPLTCDRSGKFCLFPKEEADFIKFLETQAPTLVHLELEGAYRNEVYQTIFAKLPHLKILKINFRYLPVDKEFYEALPPLTGLKELHCYLNHPSMVVALGMCGKCPNIDTFKSPWASPEIFSFLARNNPLLKVLSLNFIDSRILSLLKAFFTDNPTADTLHSPFEEKVAKIAEMKALMSVPNVKHLKFQGDFRSMRKIYDLVKVDFMGLKSLELNLKDQIEERKLFIESPDVVSNWKPMIEYFDCRTVTGAPRKRQNVDSSAPDVSAEGETDEQQNHSGRSKYPNRSKIRKYF